MDVGFEKATSNNLPSVDAIMVHEFYRTNPDFMQPESRNVKTTRATRGVYGDSAVGYVQVKREDNIKAKITPEPPPEHKIHKNSYNVIVKVDEAEQTVNECKCLDCSAAEGGCKHSIAILMWLHRRTEEPAVTSVECYWKVSKLAKVGSSLKYATLKDLSSKPIPDVPDVGANFRQAVLQRGQEVHSAGTLFLPKYGDDCISKVCLYKLSLHYKEEMDQMDQDKSPDAFLEYLTKQMTVRDCHLTEARTREQRKAPDWYKVRFGRITASKLYEASRCTTLEGSLVESILGACRPIKTDAMERGILMEDDVLSEFQKHYGKVNRCGIFVNGIFGASPDGLTREHIVEVKCPQTTKTMKNYVDEEGNIAKKPRAQMQMYLTKRKLGYFCVAEPDFDKSRHFNVFEVEFNEKTTSALLQDAERFWKLAIFPKLMAD